MKEYEEFKNEFIKLYNEVEFNKIDKMVQSASEASIKHKNFINKIDDWECSLDIEKLNQLNFNYFIHLYNEKLNTEINLDFGFGVDAPNDLISYSFDGISNKYSNLEVKIISDIILDEERIKQHFNNKKNIIKNLPNEFLYNNLLKMSEIVFKKEKQNILDLYNKQNYDVYFTGGTTKINEFYKNKFKEYNDAGIYWKVIYTTEIVDKTLY